MTRAPRSAAAGSTTWRSWSPAIRRRSRRRRARPSTAATGSSSSRAATGRCATRRRPSHRRASMWASSRAAPATCTRRPSGCRARCQRRSRRWQRASRRRSITRRCSSSRRPTSRQAAGPMPGMAFGVACGTGFDAQLIAATDREQKRRYGIAAYFLAASRLLPRLQPHATVLVVDGVRIELEAVVVLVANCGEAIPGTLRPRLPLDAADGLLHVFVLPAGRDHGRRARHARADDRGDARIVRVRPLDAAGGARGAGGDDARRGRPRWTATHTRRRGSRRGSSRAPSGSSAARRDERARCRTGAHHGTHVRRARARRRPAEARHALHPRRADGRSSRS